MTNNPPKPADKPASEFEPLEHGSFADGFSSRTVVGALFVAIVMMPGAIYIGLVAGQSLGGAAEWVTIILFAELARRSFTQLRRQEIYILFYVASGVAAAAAGAGGPFATLIWDQYLKQAPETSTIAANIPDWVVPSITSPAMQNRNLAHVDWWWSHSSGILSPVMLIFFGYVLGRLGYFGFGYLLFRLTSDRERLPFPLAPIGAEGATALAESTERTESGKPADSWRRRVFSVGAACGIVFGCVYILVPVVTGLFLSKQVTILPIPFADFTSNVENILPGSLVTISFEAGLLLLGMVLPFRIVVGAFVAMFLTNLIGNPLLVKCGLAKHWQPGSTMLVNQMLLGYDFWISAGIGIALAVFAVGAWAVAKTLFGGKPEATAQAEPAHVPGDPPYRTASRERGDFPIWLALLLFVISAAVPCIICAKLVPDFPVWIVALFAFVWSPLQSYITARLTGLTGQGIGIPYLMQTVFIASGYKKVDIWFAPVPFYDYGGAAQRFRELELTRTKFTSVIKAEVLMLPVVWISSFVFWWFFWHIQQIPSSSLPFVARMWPVAARQTYIMLTANSGHHSLLMEALKPEIIGGAAGIGLVAYILMAAVGLPLEFFYGFISGMGVPSHVEINAFIGALLGRYYFSRKFGTERWTRYVPVVAAGFACGAGLSAMLGVALSLIANCVKELPY